MYTPLNADTEVYRLVCENFNDRVIGSNMIRYYNIRSVEVIWHSTRINTEYYYVINRYFRQKYRHPIYYRDAVRLWAIDEEDYNIILYGATDAVNSLCKIYYIHFPAVLEIKRCFLFI